MKFTILYQGNIENSFLQGQFNKTDLLDIMISHKDYKKILLEKLDLLDSNNANNIFISLTPLETYADIYKVLKENNAPIDSFDINQHSVYCYDIINFPIAINELKNILKKFEFTDDPACCYYIDSKKEKIFAGILKFNLQFLIERKECNLFLLGPLERRIEVNISDFITRLDTPKALIDLFASNFHLRHFNHLTQNGPYFKKISSDKEKISAEYSFLARIPKNLRTFYPHVGDFEEGKDKSSYEIEKVYFFDASKLLINGIFNDEKKVNIFLNALYDYLNLCPKIKVSSSEYKQILTNSFVRKNEKRFDLLKDCKEFFNLNILCKFICGVGIEEYHRMVNDKLARSIEKDDKNEIWFSHGDLCLSNILYNPETNQIKLIDPKGSKSKEQDFLPAYYDLSKLSHSFLGRYELILNEMFDIRFDDNLQLELQYSAKNLGLDQLQTLFVRFIRKLGFELTTVRLFESSLFLSMLPLHRDNEKRMLAQLIQSYSSYKESQRG